MEQIQRVTRLGMFTASSIYRLMQGAKGGGLFGKDALKYINEKIAEIITGEAPKQAFSASMDWGNQNEKDAYLWLNRTHPHEYLGKENFKFFEFSPYAGGSPDGLCEKSVYEYKCPYNSSNHIEWLINKSQEWVKKEHYEYYVQLQFNMACTVKETGIIASYDPRTVDHQHRMAIVEMERDEDLIKELTEIRIPEAVEIITNTLKHLA